MALITDFRKRTINDLVLLFRNKSINLEPGFQRRSVWGISDRRRLMESIISGFPLPNIFLFQRNVRGRPVYDVIDGKQRLETIFMFLGIKHFKPDMFEVHMDIEGDYDWWNWPDIRKYAHRTVEDINTYDIQTVEVSGNLDEIVDLFVRINSTGKRLTSGEKRHAKFFESPFLKEAEKLIRKHRKFLLDKRVLSKGQLDRMKGTELFSELLMSIHNGGPINKKTSLDRAIGNESINRNTLGKLSREFNSTLIQLKKMFPDINQTRFKNTAEFYSLLMLLWQMKKDKFVLTDKKRNRTAFSLLKKLSNGVDELRDQYRMAKAARPRPPYSDYLLSVQGDTDSLATRERRAKVLRSLLFPIFERKASRRSFTAEQRRLVFNSTDKQKCSSCGDRLNWNNFTIDHIKAFAKGGKTTLSNAQMMCRSCNSRKGAR